MAARPGTVAGVGGSCRLWLALAALVTVATLVAACSGSPRPAAPTVTEASDGSTPGGAASTTVGAGDQSRDDGAAAVEGDGAAGSEATGDTTVIAANGSVEGGSARGGSVEGGSAGDGSVEGGSAGGGSAEGAAPEEVALGDGSGEGAAPEGVSTEGAASEGGLVEGASPAPYLEFDPAAASPIAPLTGSITTDFRLSQRRALAVKVGNGDPKDRPQAGLAAADIVYEVLVEAGFTRFIAVLHSEIPSRVGPVRSVRSSDFDILEDLATPYLASSGANSTVRREMRDAARAGTLVDVGAWAMSAPYERDRSRPSPHNLYFHYEDLGGGDPDSLPGGIPDAPPAALFEYGSSNSPPLDDAAGVTVAYTTLYGGEASHVWDHILGGWVRIQDGTLHTTETDFGVAEIAPANVVVLWMPYGRSAADRRSPQAVSYGSGQALVLTAGSVHEAVWERTEDRVGYRFTDAAGNPLTLSTGSTWLLLANTSTRWPVAEVTVLTASESAQLLADTRAARERSEQERGS